MSEQKLTGGNNSYYIVEIPKPIRPEHPPYIAECGDIIEALGMSFNTGCIFKALWRSSAAETLGLTKPGTGAGQALYDAEKILYYAARNIELLKQAQPKTPQDDHAKLKDILGVS